MGDVKSVKVDNWGVFFLQKLQNFFNKTDYCDLTLQFKDNSQLKVHRLVLSACTEYFNVLENTTNCRNDILIMPRDLQADVVVPIVNFMYTGTLEFEYRMYERLLKTAKDMNMTVLTKLLEAHKKAVPQQRSAPLVLNKVMANRQLMSDGTWRSRGLTHSAHGARPLARPISVLPNRSLPESVKLVSKYPHVVTKKGPSRFEATSDHSQSESFESFTDFSYESKPLVTEKDDDTHPQRSSNEFEKLRRSGNVNPNKRPAALRGTTPPSKKPNLQDVKEYTEAAKMRKQLASQDAEDEIEEDFGDVDDDMYSNSSDDQQASSAATDKQPRQSLALMNPPQNQNRTKLSVRDHSSKPTITLGDGNKMDHAKIISEVLKKYPHLVKNNKNIKLKIMQKPSSSTIASALQVSAASSSSTPVVVKGEPRSTRSSTSPKAPITRQIVVKKPSPAPPPVVIKKEEVSPKPPAPKMKGNRIDSKTMHALIALGAENMEGPWLCLKCGVDGKPIGIPSYKSFRRHLMQVHREKIDPRICEHCGFKSETALELQYHCFNVHDVSPPTGVDFECCHACDHVAMSKATLVEHQKESGHLPPTCPICNKPFQSKRALTMHMSVKHRHEKVTLKDKYVPNLAQSSSSAKEQPKITILSDIMLPKYEDESTASKAASIPSSEAEALSNVASGIATSLGVEDEYHEDEEEDGTEEFIEAAMANVHGVSGKKDESTGDEEGMVTKFVTEDGSEIQLTDAQKRELISQLESQDQNMVILLNQETTETVEAATTDGSDVMVVYSEPEVTKSSAKDVKNEDVLMEKSEDDNTLDSSIADNSIPIADMPIVVAENSSVEEEVEESVEHKSADETEEEDSKKVDSEKMKLLRELEGDWGDESGQDKTEVKEELDESKEDIKEDKKPAEKVAKEKKTKEEEKMETAEDADEEEESSEKKKPSEISSLLTHDWDDDDEEI